MTRRMCDLLAAWWPCALVLLPAALATLAALLARLGGANAG